MNPSAAVANPDSILSAAGGAAFAEDVTTGVYVDDKAVAYNAAETFHYPAHAHQACICAISGTACSSHGKDPIWTAWTSTDSLPTEAGYYYLTGKVTLAAKTVISGKVTLCLNGFDVDLNQKYIDVSSSDDLTILNCKAVLKG